MKYRIEDSQGGDYFIENAKSPVLAIKKAIEEGQDYECQTVEVYEETLSGIYNVDPGPPVISKVKQ